MATDFEHAKFAHGHPRISARRLNAKPINTARPHTRLAAARPAQLLDHAGPHLLQAHVAQGLSGPTPTSHTFHVSSSFIAALENTSTRSLRPTNRSSLSARLACVPTSWVCCNLCGAMQMKRMRLREQAQSRIFPRENEGDKQVSQWRPTNWIHRARLHDCKLRESVITC